MSREQIYVGSGIVTILLNNKFYNIDKNAYYFKNGTTYEPNYFVIFENKLYKVLNKTNKSPIEDSTSYQLQVSIDDLTVNALSDDIEDVKKEISSGEGETGQDFAEIKNEILNLQQNIESVSQDIEQNYLKTDNFANEFNNNLEQSTINADQIDGVLDVDNIPATALPIVKIVENESAMFALSSSDVQIGDVVKAQDTNKLYYVIDDTNLDNIAGYTEFNASVDWSTITNKPNEFTPVKHTHTLSDLTDSNTLALKTDVEAKLNIDTYNQDQEKVVKYQEFIYDGQARKTIQLNNYDSISGFGTDGQGYNIAMVSKWDKIDLGTPSLTMNLNSKDGIVQINDEKTVATLDDLASYTKNVDFEGYKTTVANDIASINGKFDEYALKVDIPNTDNFVTSETFNNALETVNSAIDSKAEKSAVDSIVENVNTINNKLETVVSYSHDDANNKDTVLLKNHDSISGLDTNGVGYNLVMVSKWNKADFGSSGIQMNLNSLNGVVQINDDKTVATVDQIPSVDNLVTVETFNTNIETINQALDSKADKTVTDGLTENINTINNKFNDYALKSEIPDVSNFINDEEVDTKINNLGIYNLGNFTQSIVAENKAKEDNIYNNINYKVLTYTVNNTDIGYIINNVASDKTTQFLFLRGVRYSRDIANGEASPWKELDSQVFLANKAINGVTFFNLTTESSSDDIKTAMSIGGSLITEDDLNQCITKGYTIREYSMYGTILVGFNGQGFTFTYVGFPNPSQDTAVMSIVIKIDGDTYSVLKNGIKGIALTSSNIDNNSTITAIKDSIQNIEEKLPHFVRINIRDPKLTSEVHEKSEILEWFKVTDDSELKQIIVSERPMYLMYGIQLTGNPYYYRFPIEYIAYESADQIKMVFSGLDTRNDKVSKYVIIINTDGTIIDDSNSNISMTITNLENDANLSDLESRIQAIENRIN